MTAYELNCFTAADAEGLYGIPVILTEWGDNELTTKVTYTGALVVGCNARFGYIMLEGGTVTVTDAEDGYPITIAGPPPTEADDTPHNVFFRAVCEVHQLTPPGLREYPSLAAFYAADARRDRSGERDYGAMWHANDKTSPQCRVSYIRATGEVYAAELRDLCRVRLLGVVPTDDTGPWHATLNAVLDGWADPDISGHDLAWVERRIAGYAARRTDGGREGSTDA